MGFYVLSNGDGTYITQSGGKYVQIRSFNQAMKFTDLAKAMNILNSSISKSIRSHYIPEFHETEEIVNRNSTDKQNEICFRAIDHGELADWQEKIQQLVELFGGTENRYSELSTKLSDVDKEITDIEHYIEFGKFNCYQGWLYEYHRAEQKGTLESSLAYKEFNGIRKAPNGMSFYNKSKWRFLVDAPFKMSHRCCDIMKKHPVKKYEKD